MDWYPLLKSVFALLFVIGIIGAISYALRRYGNFGTPVGNKGSKRLKVVESLTIDPRRRLVIVRRDDVEHLVLIGPEGETVIESGIGVRGKKSEK